MERSCPGLSDFLRPKPEYIKCPNCGGDVEIWTDEDKGECTSCGLKVSREMQTCLDWCEYADKCRQMIAVKKIREGSQ